MNHDNTTGPAFRGTNTISISSSLTEERPSFEQVEIIVSQSIHSNDTRSTKGSSHLDTKKHHTALRRNHTEINPLHDPKGRPLRRHGTETIGDVILHPFKELKLLRQRQEAYDQEKRDWNEKHKESTDSLQAIGNEEQEAITSEIQTRLIIHFRHLVGDQFIQLTDEKINQFKGPLGLTPEEIEELKTFEDTDDFIDFLEETKRNFSIKVHKTVNLKGKKHEISRGNSSQGLPCEISKSPSDPTKEEAIMTAKDKTGYVSSDRLNETKEQMSSRIRDDIFIELNNNVYAQIHSFKITVEHTAKKRKPLFIVPDPDLSDEIGEESSATWVELLGDVFYVGWLSNFTHAAHIVSHEQIGKYVAWFVVMWWTWCSSALYSSRYDSGDVVHHLYKIIELCGLIIMAGSSPTYDTNPKWFIIGYMIMKAVILIQYSILFFVSLGAHSKASRRPLGTYVAASTVSIILWGVSLLYLEDMTKRYILWYISIGFELLVHLFLQTNSRVSLAASHLGERFGLFTLIVLGENCLGFIQTVASSVGLSGINSNPDPSVMTAIMFSVAIIFCYFFMYFDDFNGEFVAKTRMSSIWMYLHFPLHLVQVAFGIALTGLIGVLTGTSHSETSQESSNDEFIVKFFWVTGGLILCFNAFIKLVNTPVKGVKSVKYDFYHDGLSTVSICC
ncbi:hypothetical protein G6F60_001029 [Rhizopus arrhizus]|nr:hypothetical protein G6F60_001029 [Rhizopus arrhizus]